MPNGGGRLGQLESDGDLDCFPSGKWLWQKVKELEMEEAKKAGDLIKAHEEIKRLESELETIKKTIKILTPK